MGRHGRKYHDISCIGGYGYDIYGEIAKNRQYGNISPIFRDISYGQRAIVFPKKCIFFCHWGSTHLTTKASLPLVRCIALKIYIQSHHIKKSLKENFKEKINYNYFIIKYKNFFLLITKNIKIIIIILLHSVFNIINKLIKYYKIVHIS